MDIPDLVRQALGDEELQAGVSLGDEDAVCLTPTRTLVYDGEGLLSDEQVSEYPHDAEQIYRKEGRRKTKFVLEYIDGQRSFTVPANRGEKVLELLLEGVLRHESVIEPTESLVGVYLFSELTLVIAEGRLVKHVGEPVWNEDFESYSFDEVTGLEFEQASVATSIVLSIDGRPQRVKVPNDKAPIVRQDLENALFSYYDVSSLAELQAVVDDGSDDAVDDADGSAAEDFSFGSGIDPLVTDHNDEVGDDVEDSFDEGAEDAFVEDALVDDTAGEPSESGASTGTGGTTATGAASAANDTAATDAASANDDTAASDATSTADGATESESPATERGRPASTDDPAMTSTDEAADRSADASDPPTSATTTAPGPAETGSNDDELAAVADRLAELTDAVERQNELLKRHHRAIKQLAADRESE